MTLNLKIELDDPALKYYREQYLMDAAGTPLQQAERDFHSEKTGFEDYMAETARQLLTSLYESERVR